MKGMKMDNNTSIGRGAETEYVDSGALEQMTGTPASTWRYWAYVGTGPASFKIGRRRVWRRADVVAWIAAQEAATGTDVAEARL